MDWFDHPICNRFWLWGWYLRNCVILAFLFYLLLLSLNCYNFVVFTFYVNPLYLNLNGLIYFLLRLNNLTYSDQLVSPATCPILLKYFCERKTYLSIYQFFLTVFVDFQLLCHRAEILLFLKLKKRRVHIFLQRAEARFLSVSLTST